MSSSTFTNNEPRQLQEQSGESPTNEYVSGGVVRSLHDSILTMYARTLIDWLWSNNQDLVQKFLENGFITTQAESVQNDTTLSSYRYYSIVRRSLLNYSSVYSSVSCDVDN